MIKEELYSVENHWHNCVKHKCIHQFLQIIFLYKPKGEVQLDQFVTNFEYCSLYFKKYHFGNWLFRFLPAKFLHIYFTLSVTNV